MAKAKTIVLLAWISILVGSCNFHQPDLNGNLTSNLKPMNPRDRLIMTALEEVGTKEEGGNNKGKRVGEYLASTGLPQGHPWCAAFTKWVYEKEGVETEGANAWSPSWFPADRTYWKRGDGMDKIMRGDVFGIHYVNLGRIGHVGIVEYVRDDGWLFTIEGNTSDEGGRDGDVVKRSRRSLKMTSKIANWID